MNGARWAAIALVVSGAAFAQAFAPFKMTHNGYAYMVDGRLCLTVKLPESRKDVLKLPFAKPCGYGLGKHGWVTLRCGSGDAVPSIKALRGWVAESWHAVQGAPAGAKKPSRTSPPNARPLARRGRNS